MRHARHNFRLHVRHDVVPVFRILGCLFRQQFPQVAGLDVRRHASRLQILQVVAYVLDHLLAAAAELVAIHPGHNWIWGVRINFTRILQAQDGGVGWVLKWCHEIGGLNVMVNGVK